MKKKYNHHYWIFSIASHLTIFILFNIYFSPSQPTLAGNTQEKILSSFIYEGNLLQSTAENNINKNKFNTKISSKKQILVKEKESVNSISSNKIELEKKIIDSNDAFADPTSSRNGASQGELTSALIALLHNAIQSKQTYPPSALHMERQGRVKVAFTLHTDGNITELRIITTSGTASLDRAALAAVNNAAPFHQATQYIQESKDYQIDVVFELT